MKKLLKSFWKRNLGFFNLAVISALEYRFNYFIDAIVQPAIAMCIELLLWVAVFHSLDSDTIQGFTKNQYFAYVVWAPFIARVTTNWMYEFKMMQEIDLGTINTALTRPYYFYEYYLSQLLGYKLVTTLISITIPIGVSISFSLPVSYDKIPFVLIYITYYLILIHSISFVVSSLAFFFTKAQAFTVAKNLFLWVLTGELFPLDLLPEWAKSIFLSLPFAGGVYIPVGLLTGRVSWEMVGQNAASIAVSIIFFNILGHYLWNRGRQLYTGTGA